MVVLNALRYVAAYLDWAVVGILDFLVKVGARALGSFTPVRGGGAMHWHRGYWEGRPVFDAWREPRAYTVRLAGYELVIDLET